MNTISKNPEMCKGGVTAFAWHKHLSLTLLRQYGLTESGTAIRFDYGSDRRARVRLSVEDSHSTRWVKDDERPQGVYRLPESPVGPNILIVEGESDALTAWEHGYPAIGIPGAKAYGLLEIEDLASADCAIVVREPDTGGTTFVQGVEQRLMRIGFTGRIVQATMSPHKDLNEVNCALRNAIQYEALFRDFVDKAIHEAVPIADEPILPIKSTERRLAMTCVADVVPERVQWLWRNRIPRSMLSMLCGDPGTGKSFSSLAVAAAVSSGNPLPDGDARGEPQNVILWNAEDSKSHTIRPRAQAAGADLGRLFIIDNEVDERGNVRRFTLDSVDLIKKSMDDIGNVGLIIVDPVGSLFAGIDSHRENEVRAGLLPLQELAQQTGAAVLAIAHLNKKEAEKAVYRITGSIGFSAVPRSVLLCGLDPEDESKHIIVRAKGNLCAAPSAVEFTIDREGVFWWGGLRDMNPEALLATPRYGGVRQKAEDFLRQALGDGPVPSKDIERMAQERGLGIRTLKTAQKNLGVISIKKGARWEMSLANLQECNQECKVV
jgi:AAA domain